MTYRLNKNHINHLDGMRALAAIFVMFNHGFRFPWPNLPSLGVEQHPEGILLPFLSWMRYGHFAVTFFIAISGYCLALNFSKQKLTVKNTFKFYAQRSWRILPTYYAALFVSLVLIFLLIGEKTGDQWDACLPVTWQGILSRILMVQDIFIVQQINNPFWSVATEWRIYFFAPLFLFLIQKFGSIKSLVGIVFVCGIIFFCGVRHITVLYLAIFSMGFVTGSYRGNIPLWIYPCARFFWILTTFLIFSLTVLCEYSMLYSKLYPFDFVIGVASCCLFLDYSRPDYTPPFKKFLEKKFLVWIGGFSYSIYLMHFPLQSIVWRYIIAPVDLPLEWRFFLFVGIGFPMVIGLSWLFYLKFERPIVRNRPSILRYDR